MNCEAIVIAGGQNLKRLLQKRGWGRRPLPSGAAVATPRAGAQFAYLIVVWMVPQRAVEPLHNQAEELQPPGRHL
jgi:hypothetical protein